MTNTTYRAGIIGLGFIGGADQVSGDALGQQVSGLDGTHFDALSNHPRVNRIVGSSRDPGRRERFALRASTAAYASWEEMLALESLDIVSVATYAPVHAEITVACAKQGIRAIYCEKPIATRNSPTPNKCSKHVRKQVRCWSSTTKDGSTSTTDDCEILSPQTVWEN